MCLQVLLTKHPRSFSDRFDNLCLLKYGGFYHFPVGYLTGA